MIFYSTGGRGSTGIRSYESNLFSSGGFFVGNLIV
jgi:hypothetical protein